MIYERSRSELQRYLYVGHTRNLTFGDHMHSSFEFMTVTKGATQAVLSGISYTLRAGQAMLILPNRVHRFAVPEGAESENITVIFSPDYVKDFYSVVRGCDFQKPVFNYTMYDTLLSLDASRLFHCMSRLYGICAEAYEVCEPTVSEQRNDPLVRKIADYIYEHYESDINLDSLAKELGYNYCYLSDFINSRFGMNFRNLLNSYRIDLALTLLRTTELSVTEISGRCGFSSPRSFNRAFRKIQGISPRELTYAKI